MRKFSQIRTTLFQFFFFFFQFYEKALKDMLLTWNATLWNILYSADANKIRSHETAWNWNV